jgi:hypothetical protein
MSFRILWLNGFAELHNLHPVGFLVQKAVVLHEPVLAGELPVVAHPEAKELLRRGRNS